MNNAIPRVKPGKATTNVGSVSTKTPQASAPLHLLMGKKRVAFLAIARTLSTVLVDTYGDGFSISKFEKALIELRGQSSLKDLIHLEDSLLSCHARYVVAKQDMLEEQAKFKSAYSTAPILTETVGSVEELFAEASGPRKVAVGLKRTDLSE
jgi:hypothetical protein